MKIKLKSNGSEVFIGDVKILRERLVNINFAELYPFERHSDYTRLTLEFIAKITFDEEGHFVIFDIEEQK